MALAGDSGLLQLWDCRQNTMVITRRFEAGMQPRALAFSPDGNTLAVGFESGQISVLETLGLREVTPRYQPHNDDDDENKKKEKRKEKIKKDWGGGGGGESER